MRIGRISIVVPDYDEAISYYRDILGFELLEDTRMSESKRWVRLSPGDGCEVLLAKAKNESERLAIGNQSGGRVWLFLYTDDFWADYQRMKNADVDFIGEPREEEYGTVIVFRDCYGNKWDFIQEK